jgi:anti-sigma regulatory factor (Ser/Thr protein kinase)
VVVRLLKGATMTDLASHSLEFDRLPPRRARRFVRKTLLRWGRPDLVRDAELLVDELVANAMLHAHGSGVDVTVRAEGDIVRVEVADPDPDFTIDFRRSADAPPRLGLRIVDSVADRWGVEPSEHGKVVWFELDRGHAEDALRAVQLAN